MGVFCEVKGAGREGSTLPHHSRTWSVAAAARLRWPCAWLNIFWVHAGQRSLAAAATGVVSSRNLPTVKPEVAGYRYQSCQR